MATNILTSSEIVDWYVENVSDTVDTNTKKTFIELKNSVEGWKKGTLVRGVVSKPVDIKAQIRENMSLFINQLSVQNYKPTLSKIKKEMEGSTIARDIFTEIVVQTGMLQENNLELIVGLLEDLGMIQSVIKHLQITLSKMSFIQIDESSYEQLCVDTKNNTLFKNGYLFLSYIFNKTDEISINGILSYLNFIQNSLGENKELNEKYIQLYVMIVSTVDKKLTQNSPEFMRDILKLLETWKNDKAKYSNKARFTILDYLDTLQ